MQQSTIVPSCNHGKLCDFKNTFGNIFGFSGKIIQTDYIFGTGMFHTNL